MNFNNTTYDYDATTNTWKDEEGNEQTAAEIESLKRQKVSLDAQLAQIDAVKKRLTTETLDPQEANRKVETKSS